MVTYELIKQLESNSIFLDLLKKGVVPIKVLDYKCIYERWLTFKAEGFSNAESYTYTADEYKLSENTIRNAVNFMSK